MQKWDEPRTIQLTSWIHPFEYWASWDTTEQFSGPGEAAISSIFGEWHHFIKGGTTDLAIYIRQQNIVVGHDVVLSTNSLMDNIHPIHHKSSLGGGGSAAATPRGLAVSPPSCTWRYFFSTHFFDIIEAVDSLIMLSTPKYYTQQQSTYQWRVWISGEHGACFGLSTNGVRLLILFCTFSPSLTLTRHYSLISNAWRK